MDVDSGAVQSVPVAGTQSTALRHARKERQRCAMLRDKQLLQDLMLPKSTCDIGIQTEEADLLTRDEASAFLEIAMKEKQEKQEMQMHQITVKIQNLCKANDELSKKNEQLEMSLVDKDEAAELLDCSLDTLEGTHGQAIAQKDELIQRFMKALAEREQKIKCLEDQLCSK